jgi:membrane protease YdiL (CAAX protease family)
MSDLPEVLLELAALLAVAAVCAVVGLSLWYSLARKGRHLFPAQHYRVVPSGGIETGIVVFIVLFLCPPIVMLVLIRTGFYTWSYGPNFPLPSASQETVAVSQLVRIRWELWVSVFAFPFQVALVPLLLRLGSGTRPYQLGLTTHRLTANVTLACLFWLALTPVVYGVQFLVALCEALMHRAPEEHPFAELAKDNPTGAEFVAIVVAALVAAPMLEEVIFRGLLQNFFASRPERGRIAIAAAIAAALALGWKSAGAWPLVFVVAMTPGYFLCDRLSWRWLPRPAAVRGIYGTALLFGAVHSNVWPSPIPLFVLGLGLGYLAFRTQSLVGPMMLHSLFNAVAAVEICLGYFFPS